jgi:tRNA wybutosine-synthesizing protein 3
MGLGFDSIIGFMDSAGFATSFVDEAQLSVLVAVANTRFKQNTERTQKFRSSLLRTFKTSEEGEMEDEKGKGRRKKEEGLRRQSELRKKRTEADEAELKSSDEQLDVFAASLFED